MKSSKVSSELIFNFNLKLKLILPRKNEFLKGFFKEDKSQLKKKLPGASTVEAHARPFFFDLAVVFPKKILKNSDLAWVIYL